MDSRDEELTLENVDEQVARELAQLQAFQPSTMTPLARTVRDLQIIYEEKRRLEHVWERLNNHASAFDSTALYSVVSPEDGEEGMPTATLPLRVPGKAVQDGNGLLGGNFNTFPRKPGPGKQAQKQRRRRNLGFGLVAALVLLTICAVIFARPMLASHFSGSQTGGHPTPVKTVSPPPNLAPQVGPTITPTATPTPTTTPQPTVSVPAMKEYNTQYFKIQYPAGWIMTSVTTGGTSRQTVQIRPSATSAVSVTIDAMYPNDLSGSQLLNIDPDVNLGTLVSTSTMTYHGIPWTVGIVNLAGSLLSQPSTLEVAYSNQHAPYKIEFRAPPGMFASYSSIFHNMLASFYPGQ